MISIAYILVYFLKGRLPWQGRQKSTDEIATMKIETSNEELCKDLPKEFNDMLKYLSALRFSEEPDYQKVIDLLNVVFFENFVEKES